MDRTARLEGRPQGDRAHTVGERSSGPLSFDPELLRRAIALRSQKRGTREAAARAMTSRLPLAPLVLLSMMLVPTTTAAAEDTLAECTARVGGPGEAAFRAFDREMRGALAIQDTAALALVVAFPLRVSYPDGVNISLDNPTALQARFQEVFPPAIRSAVMNQKLQNAVCNDGGIMYGSGDIWIKVVGQGNLQRYAVGTINIPGLGKKPGPGAWPFKTPRVEFTCTTEQHRIIVDVNKEGVHRYRAWNRPRLVTEKPDLVLSSGTREVDGTYPCTHSIWTFQRGDTTFVLSEPGCVDDVPPGATGTLEVQGGDKQALETWCY